VADYKGQLKLLRRRISSFRSEVDAIEVDAAAIVRTIGDRAERRAILVEWVHEVLYALGEAEIQGSVEAGANCQHGEDSFILLKIKRRVA
jgi:hypothetical protein